MLRINPYRGKSSEHATCPSADGRCNDALYPNLKLLELDSSHALRHRDKDLLVKRWDGVIELVVRPRIVGTVFTPLSIVNGVPFPGTWQMPRKLNGPRNVLCCRWCELQEFSARS